jgi:hypothetical protein
MKGQFEPFVRKVGYLYSCSRISYLYSIKHYKWFLYLPPKEVLLLAVILGVLLTQGHQAAVGLRRHIPV